MTASAAPFRTYVLLSLAFAYLHRVIPSSFALTLRRTTTLPVAVIAELVQLPFHVQALPRKAGHTGHHQRPYTVARRPARRCHLPRARCTRQRTSRSSCSHDRGAVIYLDPLFPCGM